MRFAPAVTQYYDEDYVERFFDKVDAEGDCWEWMGRRDGAGYGMAPARPRRLVAGITGTSPVRAHRVVLELVYGEIPPELVVDHLCRNRCCVNPAHLELVTSALNSMRGFAPAVRVHKQGVCSKGHPMADAYVVHRSTGRVQRVCRSCDNLRRGVDPASMGPLHRKKTHCKRGHELTPDNVWYQQTPSGRRARVCKACKKIRNAARSVPAGAR